jgi:ABC-type spermidine/putrescine transport system permease subunit II
MRVFQFNSGTRAVVYGVTGLVYLFLFAPILFVIYGSFDPNEIMSFPYKGFSLRWYREFFASATLYLAATNSVIVAVLASVVATCVGGLAAFATARLSFRGKGLLQAAVAAPMVISKVILGVSLLVLIVKFGVPRGFASLIALHALLCLPFGYLVVWARLVTAGRDYEEAALTLGANDLETAFEITIPLLGAALTGSFLLCVTVSFDEFSATQFLVIPQTQTMPIQIYSMIQTGVTPTVNVFATVLTIVTIAIPLIAQLAFGALHRAYLRH